MQIMDVNIRDIDVIFEGAPGLGELLRTGGEELKDRLLLNARFNAAAGHPAAEGYELAVAFQSQRAIVCFRLYPARDVEGEWSTEPLCEVVVDMDRHYRRQWRDYLDVSTEYCKGSNPAYISVLDVVKRQAHNEIATKLIGFLEHKGLIFNEDSSLDCSRKIVELVLDYSAMFDERCRSAVSYFKQGQLPDYTR